MVEAVADQQQATAEVLVEVRCICNNPVCVCVCVGVGACERVCVLFNVLSLCRCPCPVSLLCVHVCVCVFVCDLSLPPSLSSPTSPHSSSFFVVAKIDMPASGRACMFTFCPALHCRHRLPSLLALLWLAWPWCARGNAGSRWWTSASLMRKRPASSR